MCPGCESRAGREPDVTAKRAAVWGIDSETEPAVNVGFGASSEKDSGLRLYENDGLFVGPHSAVGEKLAQRQAQVTRVR